MSSGGRKLQDIFDTGTRRLEQLEQSEKQELEISASKAVDACGRKESQVMQRMDTALNVEEKQILNYTSSAVDLVQAAICAEKEENERFYTSLENSLKLSLQSLTDDITRVRESLLQTSSHDAEYRLALFEGDLQTLVSHLRVTGLDSAEVQRVRARQHQVELTRKLETYTAQLLERESRVSSEIHADASAHSEAAYQTLETHLTYFCDLAEQHVALISESAQTKAAVLQEKTEQHSAALEQSYQTAEDKLRASYQTVLAEGLTTRQTLSSHLFEQLQQSLESNRSDLSQKLEKFRNDSADYLDQLKQAMSLSETRIKERTAELTDRLDDALTERLEAARTNRDTVSNDRMTMMQKISQELGQIESSFERRLTDISRDSLSRLSTICLEAENSIVAAHDNCVQEFKTMAQSTQSDMEERTARLLTALEQAEEAAISLIKEAAGDNGTPQA
jgi:hypothetical protein